MKTRVFVVAAFVAGIAQAQSGGAALGNVTESPTWQTSARWHRFLRKTIPGTLRISQDGVEFQSPKFHEHWAYIDIHSFELSATELTLKSYQNRPWHEPGERNFRFSWTEPMPPEVAAQLTARVGKPVLNGIPTANATALAQIPAHHRMWSGGSNGTLRLKDDGIDYVTDNGHDSRTWRWVDIQTIANPNPYEFRVAGYREIVEFDLKQPLPRAVFEQIWDRLYAAGPNLSPAHHAHEAAHR